MDIDWEQQDRDSLARFEKQCRNQMTRSAADRDFSQACLNAKIWTKDLEPKRDEYGGLVYTKHQTSIGACEGREDISAVLQMQYPILKRLDFIKRLIVGCFIALLYVCYKVS